MIAPTTGAVQQVQPRKQHATRVGCIREIRVANREEEVGVRHCPILFGRLGVAGHTSIIIGGAQIAHKTLVNTDVANHHSPGYYLVCSYFALKNTGGVQRTINCSKMNSPNLASAFFGFSSIPFLILQFRIDVNAYSLPR